MCVVLGLGMAVLVLGADFVRRGLQRRGLESHSTRHFLKRHHVHAGVVQGVHGPVHPHHGNGAWLCVGFWRCGVGAFCTQAYGVVFAWLLRAMDGRSWSTHGLLRVCIWLGFM